ncbi:MAG: DUF4339 domain-containing protein [Bacteriovorax sp.]|nr:DUF4339 domain-containing protein [Bacteriovorax sp.]
MNKEWFVFKGTHHLGPFSVEEMVEFYRDEEINTQTLIWKEGSEKWDPLSKVLTFQFLFEKAETTPELPVAGEIPPPMPSAPSLPKIPFDDELPPPIPLDAILDPLGSRRLNVKVAEKKSKISTLSLVVAASFFAVVLGWYALTQRDADIQLKIKGIMPVYLERLEAMALKKSNSFELALALSLDSQTLWSSTNKPGEIFVNIQLKSIPSKVLGTDEVEVLVKGEFQNHLGKFSKMLLTKGTKFLPGEYNIHAEAREIHFLNRNFRKLASIAFFKALNKTYVFDGKTLIYAGTPREFEKRIEEYSAGIVNELLKPYQDKLERVQTFESILNATSQNYLMELEKAKTGKSISLFETKFIKEISPLLQTLVVKAQELSKDPVINEDKNAGPVVAPYREQVLLGKQIGEMASDMITRTQSFKKLSDKDKSELRTEFDKRAKAIKLQIDLNINKLESEIQKISK